MSRQARKISVTGFYHIVFRGINRLHLFEEDSDFIYFLNNLQHLKHEMQFEIHAYCLMSNHVHMLIKERAPGDISLIMKRLLTKYAMYFNRKYDRSGALISSRYKSVPIEIDEYFIPLLCYIHQNPIRAGIVSIAEEYRFSSYREYLYGGNLTDTEFSLGLLGRDEWFKLHQIITKHDFDVTGRTNIREEEIRRRIMQYTGGREIHEIVSWPKIERDYVIRQLKEKEGLSIRQIERATGISRGVIAKVVK
ncbi:transposase [Sporomusa sphaeroides]|uniref:transposase n=1 Tax=Sporomusa sphaeroides TaxID=47679 RepID=UPI002C1F68F4|nr:transposase [Sporomusa sphaeroides]HML35409.1 transposase [Sporomusa sphaeroides]